MLTLAGALCGGLGGMGMMTVGNPCAWQEAADPLEDQEETGEEIPYSEKYSLWSMLQQGIIEIEQPAAAPGRLYGVIGAGQTPLVLLAGIGG